MLSVEQTLIIFKPDAVERQLCSRFLRLWEKKGYRIVSIRMHQATREEMIEHYVEHKARTFFPSLIDRMTASPCMFIVLEGTQVIKWSRLLIGATNPLEADIGSIRGSYGLSTHANLVHASDSVESAKREIDIWFPKR